MSDVPSQIAALANGKSPLETLQLPSGVVLQLRQPLGSHYTTAMEIAQGNETLARIFETLLCVAFVNGEPIPVPRTRKLMDVLSDKIGREGIEEMLQWHRAKTQPDLAQALEEMGAEALQDQTALFNRVKELKAARLKNSQPTQV